MNISKSKTELINELTTTTSKIWKRQFLNSEEFRHKYLGEWGAIDHEKMRDAKRYNEMNVENKRLKKRIEELEREVEFVRELEVKSW